MRVARRREGVGVGEVLSFYVVVTDRIYVTNKAILDGDRVQATKRGVWGASE